MKHKILPKYRNDRNMGDDGEYTSLRSGIARDGLLVAPEINYNARTGCTEIGVQGSAVAYKNLLAAFDGAAVCTGIEVNEKTRAERTMESQVFDNRSRVITEPAIVRTIVVKDPQNKPGQSFVTAMGVLVNRGYRQKETFVWAQKAFPNIEPGIIVSEPRSVASRG